MSALPTATDKTLASGVELELAVRRAFAQNESGDSLIDQAGILSFLKSTNTQDTADATLQTWIDSNLPTFDLDKDGQLTYNEVNGDISDDGGMTNSTHVSTCCDGGRSSSSCITAWWRARSAQSSPAAWPPPPRPPRRGGGRSRSKRSRRRPLPKRSRQRSCSSKRKRTRTKPTEACLHAAVRGASWLTWSSRGR
jgi:hypothetical protein